MKLLAIGDIHGCFDALQTLVRFAPYERANRIVFLGDYVDRGPQTMEVLDWLIDQQQVRDVITLRGNHEIMMLDARKNSIAYSDWIRFGGDATLASYDDTTSARLDVIREEHWSFMEATQPFYETESEFFVHATVDASRPLDEQHEAELFWHSLTVHQPPHISGKRMICGHTSQKSGKPLDLGHAVCIDTWVYGEGWLTALDINTDEYWQADQKGRTRKGQLKRTVDRA